MLCGEIMYCCATILQVMASNDHDHPSFAATATAVTAFSAPQTEPQASGTRRKRKRRSRNKTVSFELYRNLSGELGDPHTLSADGNLEDLKSFTEVFGATIKERNESGETLLHAATRTNQIAVMQYLIDSGIDLNAVDNDGNTALHVAVINGHIEAVHLLLTSGASDTILNKKMDAPLHIVARNNDTNMMGTFLEYPVELVIPGYRKRTPLHVAAEHDNLEVCEIVHNSVLAKESLKKQGGFRLCAADEDNLTPLHFAARLGSHRVVDFMISKCVEHGYPVETVIGFLDEENSTPLHAAVDGGHVDVTRVLLKYGADPTVIKYEQLPPLHLACSQGKLDVVQAMVETCGKEILQARDQYGQTPIHRCANAIASAQVISYFVRFKVELDPIDNLGRTPLHIAVVSGSLPAVKELIENGANPLIQDQQGRSILHHAVHRNRKAIVTYVLDLPCAHELTMLKDKDSHSPIHVALSLGYSHIVVALMSAVRCQLPNHKDSHNNNYLHLAAASGDWKALSILQDIPSCQALLNETNSCGATPLHMAAGNGHVRCVELLLSQGAMVHKCSFGMTPFMYALFMGKPECAKVCFEAHPFQKDWTDDKGNNALHLAVNSGNPACVVLALDKGVSITLNFDEESFFDHVLEKDHEKIAMAVVQHDRWQECLDLGSPKHPSPTIGIIIQMPDVAKALYDRCRTTSARDKSHPDYWEKYDFKYLRLKDDTDEVTSANETDASEEDPLILKDVLSPVIKYKRSIVSPTAPLVTIAARCARRHKSLPLMQALRTMVRFRRVQLLTHPVIEAYIKSKWRDYGRWIYLIGFLFFVIQVALLTSFVLVAPQPSKVLEIEGRNDTNPDFSIRANTLRFATLAFSFVSLLQLVHAVVGIGWDTLNFVDNTWLWSLGFALLCTFIGLIPFRGLHSALWEATALAVFFSWFTLMLMLQLFDVFGVYVTMFLAITRTVFQVLLVCFILVIAFALTFYVLTGNVTDFSTFGYSIFTNFGHLLGEIDYNAFVQKSSTDELAFDSLTLILVVVLAILMAIVVMNLLIGLAVGDISAIQRNAIIEKRNLEIQVFSRFDGNLPKRLLARVDRRCYKVYPNSHVGLVRRLWRFFWRTIKVDDESIENAQELSVPTADQYNRDLEGIKQKLEELTVNQERLIEMIREMTSAQRQAQKEQNELSQFQD